MIDKMVNMSLRDYFAAAALQGHLASYAGIDCPTPDSESAARRAYGFADAMLAERENLSTKEQA